MFCIKFIFTSANHALKSLSTYPFPLFFEEWGLDKAKVTDSWDNKGDIVIGNDAVIMSGVTIGDGAIIGTRTFLQSQQDVLLLLFMYVAMKRSFVQRERKVKSYRRV